MIEDAAQAFGASIGSLRAGAVGAAGTFSFFDEEPLRLGDGGLVSTSDPALAERIRLLRFHGSKDKETFEAVGMNSRLDAIQAAALRLFLGHVDRWNAERRRLPRATPSSASASSASCRRTSRGVYHMYVVRSPERDPIAAALRAADIGCATYYTTPLHLQPVYQPLGYEAGSLLETERAARETIALPLWAGITVAQQEEVVATIRAAIETGATHEVA